MTRPHVSFTEMQHRTAEDYALLDGFQRTATDVTPSPIRSEKCSLEPPGMLQ